MPDATDKPRPPRPVVPPPDMKALASRSASPAKGAGAASAGTQATPPGPAAGGAVTAAAVAAPPAPPPVTKKAVTELLPPEIAALREQIVEALKERKRSGQPVTIAVEHKEFSFTGRVIRIEAEEGYAVLENVDGRRRGCYFILGGKLTSKDGLEIDLPIDGVAR